MKSVLINSIPKAGTNMLAKLLDIAGYQEIGHIGRKVVSRNRLYQLVDKIDIFSSKWTLGIDYPTQHGSFAARALLSSLTEASYITAHVPFDDDIEAVLEKQHCVSICVIRDPRAIVSSFIRYAEKQSAHPAHKAIKSMNVVEAVKYVVDGDHVSGLNTLAMRCKDIEEWNGCGNVSQIRYEDLIGERGGGDENIKSEKIALLCKMLQIDDEKRAMIDAGLYGGGRSTFDRGKIYGWKEHLPAEGVDYIERHAGEYLALWGYV